MTLAFLLGILISAVNQAVKLIMRLFGVSKETAKKTVLFIMFLGAIVFTIGQKFEWFSMAQITFLISTITVAIGSYEIFLNKTGLDSWMKDTLDLQRGDEA